MAVSEPIRKPLAAYSGLPVTHASFDYFKENEQTLVEKPYYFTGPLSPEQESLRTNFGFEKHRHVPAHDLRDVLPSISLETHGLELDTRPSSLLQNLGDKNVRDQYLLEVADYFKEKFLAENVICYDIRFRKVSATDVSDSADTVPEKSIVGTAEDPDAPAWAAHVDHTKDGGLRRTRRILTDSESRYLSPDYRLRIVNLWRPLHGTVTDVPLAFCDPDSVEEADLIATDRPSAKRVGEVYNLKFNANQRWYWIRDMTEDEAALFISWDSENQGVFPHAAFRIGYADPPRESVEVRALVVTKRGEN
ncbi:MAG: hypothetical protein M1820_006926 [Bogoriella megaspora]|nr:MAG: hypothetical protein M1820_006926 [Bogoriella megaspora]